MQGRKSYKYAPTSGGTLIVIYFFVISLLFILLFPLIPWYDVISLDRVAL
jgi:hypothetical protein